MARGVEMIVIRRIKRIHAGHRRLQKLRIRFAVAHSHLSQTSRDQGHKRMIVGQMFFDTRLVRNEDHVELRVARCDRFFQLLQESKG